MIHTVRRTIDSESVSMDWSTREKARACVVQCLEMAEIRESLIQRLADRIMKTGYFNFGGMKLEVESWHERMREPKQ